MGAQWFITGLRLCIAWQLIATKLVPFGICLWCAVTESQRTSDSTQILVTVPLLSTRDRKMRRESFR
jgi:hypothetical protein